MFKTEQKHAGPTEAQYAEIEKVFEETGILTVKDRVTGKWIKPQERCGGVKWEVPYQNVPEYGTATGEQPGSDPMGKPGGDGSRETFLVRSTYRLLVGTKKFPDGLVFGGYEVWRQDNFFEDTEKFSLTNFRFDVWTEEQNALAAYAREITYVTDEMWKAAEKDAQRRRDGLNKTQQDPVGTLADALSKALERKSEQGPPPEVLAAAGFSKDEKTGAWTFKGKPVGVSA